MANFKDVRKLCLHIVDGVEVDKKLRGENSLGERRINLSYWEWNRYQEIIFCLNCIPSLNAFKFGGGFSGEGCEGRSCSSCILNSGCICGEDSVADTELFCLSNVFFLLGRVINLLGKKKRKRPEKASSLHLHFWQLFLPDLPCLSLGHSSGTAPGRAAGPGESTGKTAQAAAADSQLLILDGTKKCNPLLWGIGSLIVLVPCQSKPKPKHCWILRKRQQRFRGRGVFGFEGGFTAGSPQPATACDHRPLGSGVACQSGFRSPPGEPVGICKHRTVPGCEELAKRVWSRQAGSRARFQQTSDFQVSGSRSFVALRLSLPGLVW